MARVWAASMAAALLALTALTPREALAQGQSAMGALEEALASGAKPPPLAGLEVLRLKGAKLDGLLLVERLPAGGHLAEVALSYQGKRARLPVKLTRQEPDANACAAWRVVWAPSAEYISALLSLIASEALPEPAQASPLWVSQARMPALPLIVTRARVISPYGAIALDAQVQDVSPRASELAPARELIEHTKRWLEQTLEHEPGAAAVDVLAQRELTWLQLQRVVLGVSSLGVFRLHVITRQADGLGALTVHAPVFGQLPPEQRPVALILAHEPLGQGRPHGFRAMWGPRALALPERCDAQVSLCAQDADALSQALKALAQALSAGDGSGQAAPPRHVLFAAGGQLELGQAVWMMSVMTQALGMSPEALFLGYIRR